MSQKLKEFKISSYIQDSLEKFGKLATKLFVYKSYVIQFKDV